MSGRGRGGRGGRGGNNKSFSKEQLTSLGVSNDVAPVLVTAPPLLYPLLERKSVQFVPSLETDYLLILRQDYIDHMQLSAAYLKLPESKMNKPEHEIDKLIAQIPSTRSKFDWNLFPAELRPKMVAKRSGGDVKKVVIKKEIDVQERLNKLEKIELAAAPADTTIKEEIEETVEDEEPENEMIEDPEDEEMDDGTDYANNYFDNGEAYEDEDDNLDDGPIY